MPFAFMLAALISLCPFAPARGGGIDQSIDLTRHMKSPGALDGIPALLNPTFVDPSEVTYLADDDLVLGLFIDGEAKAYPENFGWRHEILNDTIGGRFVAVTFCPLTATGLVFDATDRDGSQFQLRVSGQLINSNLVMFDQRDRKTLYPQMIYTGITGTYEGERLELLPIVETTWRMWRQFYPDSTVPLLVVYHAPSQTAIPYNRQVDGQTLSFYQVEAKGPLPIEFEDEQTGTRWDILGRAVEGPLDGTQLRQIPAYNAMWFAWAAYFPETAIWDGEGLVGALMPAVEEGPPQPTRYDLAQNFPNPFNPETRIQYTLPAPENVRLAIYNAAGQKVRELVNAPQQPGIYLMRWDGRDQAGSAVASGTYLYRLELALSGRSMTRSMTLAR